MIARTSWIKDFLDDVTGYSPDYVPSHDTFARVFQLLSNEGMRQLLRDIAYIISESIPENHKIEGLACDGKALRGTIDEENKILYVLNVWSTKYDLCVYQIPISTKTNEITAMPNALRLLDIRGKVITFDALNTQKKIIAYISEHGAYYIAPLKENHKTAHEEISSFLNDLMTKREPDFIVTTKGHGRTETRKIWQTENVGWFQDKDEWKGLCSFAVIECERTDNKTNTTSITRSYFISNMKKDPEAFLKYKLEHWTVETGHNVLDVTMNEDSNKTKNKNAASNLSIMRVCALNLIKRFKNMDERYCKRSIKSVQNRAARDKETLLKILFGFCA